MRVALGQFAPRLGDVDGNLARMTAIIDAAAAGGADLTVFPELSTHGYALGATDPTSCLAAGDPRLTGLGAGGTDVVAGFHEAGGIRRYNSAAYLTAAGVVHTQRKLYLPNYLTWEEKKHSSPGQDLRAFDTRFGRFATLICNDAWQPALPWLAAQDGAEVILIPTNSAVPAATGDVEATGDVDTVGYWSMLLTFIARMSQCWVVFVNRVGNENGARFWGGSKVLDPAGAVVAEAPLWREETVVAELDVPAAATARRRLPLLAEARLGLIAATVRRLIDDGGHL